MFWARLGNLVWVKTWLAEPRRGLDLPARPADFGTFSGPHSGTFQECQVWLLVDIIYLLNCLEMQQISSGQRGRPYLRLEMRQKACRKNLRNGARKKVPESAGLPGRSRPRLASPSHVLAETRFPSWAQNIKNGPKWVQNRWFGLRIGPRECHGHFGPVRTGPGPKKLKSMPKNRQVQPFL